MLYDKSFIDQACSDVSLVLLFCVFINLEFVSVYKNAKKRPLSIFSHVDLTLGR